MWFGGGGGTSDGVHDTDDEGVGVDLLRRTTDIRQAGQFRAVQCRLERYKPRRPWSELLENEPPPSLLQILQAQFR